MSRWFILRTSGGRTLPLAAALRDAGHEAWSPGRTLRRYVKAKTPSGLRLIETQAAILPTFVFAREDGFAAIADLAVQDHSLLPGFSVFRQDGRVPLVGDGEVAGLRDEEARAAAVIKALHDAESRAEAERIRIAAIKSAAARRRAERELEMGRRRELSARRAAIAPNTPVEVIEHPAMVGWRGVFERADGPYAHVLFGNRSWKIKGWRVMPAALNDNPAPRGVAA